MTALYSLLFSLTGFTISKSSSLIVCCRNLLHILRLFLLFSPSTVYRGLPEWASCMVYSCYKAPVTPGLQPGYDLPATEKWANRRKNVRVVAEVVRLVAEVVGDRKEQISRGKVVVMFKTQSHRAYDRKMLQSRANRRKNVRLAAEVVRLVAEVVGDRKGQISRNKVDGHVQNLKPAIPNRKRSHDQSCDWSCHLTTSCRTQRLIVRSIVGGHDWSYDRSFMATTSRTIAFDMMDLVIDLLQSVLIARPRVRPIVRWPTTSKKDRSQYATTASGDRSKHWRSVERSPNHNQSYDQGIVRSGVTVA